MSTSVPYASPDLRTPLRHSRVSRHSREYSVTAAYLALILLLAVSHREFFDRQFFETFVTAGPVLIAAVGMTLVIVARQIDISIGSQFAVCAMLTGLLAKVGMPMAGVVPLTLLGGAAMGAINGGLVAGLRLPSIVVTLATMALYRESLRWISQGQFINDLPAGFQWFGFSQRGGEWLLILSASFVLLIFTWAMRWLAAGRAVYAVGSDEEAARLAGIRPRRVVFWIFVLMGVLTALAAILQAVRSPDVDPNQAIGWELSVIAAVVVGGTAITGGRGTLPGTLAGVLLLCTLDPALPFLDVHAEWTKAVHGGIILLAVASDGIFRRRA